MITTFTRKDWVGSQPVQGPLFPGWKHIDTFVIHYTAANEVIDGDPGEDWGQIPQWLRNTHSWYLSKHGFSLGYNWMVDQRGMSWEIRGETYRNAANNGDRNENGMGHGPDYNGTYANKWTNDPDNHNCNWHSVSCLVLVDGNDSASPAAEAEINRMVAYAKQQHPGLIVVGHKDLDYTPCPGDGLYWQVSNGKFNGSTQEGLVVEANKFRFVEKRLFDNSVGDEKSVTLQATNPNAVGVECVIHVSHSDSAGHVRAYPDGYGSNVARFTYDKGERVSVPVRVACGPDGRFTVWVKSGCNVIVDQLGVFLWEDYLIGS